MDSKPPWFCREWKWKGYSISFGGTPIRDMSMSIAFPQQAGLLEISRINFWSGVIVTLGFLQVSTLKQVFTKSKLLPKTRELLQQWPPSCKSLLKPPQNAGSTVWRLTFFTLKKMVNPGQSRVPMSGWAAQPPPKTQQQNPPASRSRGCFVGPHRWYRHPLKIDSAHGPKESYQRMPWAIAARSPGVYDESSAQLLRRSGGTKHWWGRCPRKPWLSEVVFFWREKIGRLGFNIRSYRRKYEWSM